MTDEEIKIAVAEAVGFRGIEVMTRYNGIQDYEALCGECDGIVQELPNYPEDINAIHEAEKLIETTGLWHLYIRELGKIIIRDLNGFGTWEIHCQKTEEGVTHGMINFVRATARHRAEAFLRTLGEWKE